MGKRKAIFQMAFAAVVATLVPLATATAQDSTATGDTRGPNECFRFAFGAWSTPLDWKSAGHRQPSASADAGAAPRGDASRSGADHLGDIVLYPPWWPVGVYIELDSARSRGDTLHGTATALVANGNVAVPTAKVAAIRVPCTARPPSSSH